MLPARRIFYKYIGMGHTCWYSPESIEISFFRKNIEISTNTGLKGRERGKDCSSCWNICTEWIGTLYITVQLHLDSSFGGFTPSTVFEISALIGVESDFFKLFPNSAEGDVVTVSNFFRLTFREYGLRLLEILHESFWSETDFPNIVTVGWGTTGGTDSFSIPIVAAL